MKEVVVGNQYNVRLWITGMRNGSMVAKVSDRKVEFSRTIGDYGNETHMGELSEVGFTGYDIRYDMDYDPDNEIVYLVRFYADRYNGKDRAWKLTGIKVHEAEFENGLENEPWG